MAGLSIAPISSVVSGGVFSSRRANSGMDAMAENNPYVGALNLNIAGGQALGIAKGLSNMAQHSDGAYANMFNSAVESIKASSKSDKLLSGVHKFMDFTKNHVNKFIIGTGLVKVACAEDKDEALTREGLGLGTMFACEHGMKNAIGLPQTKKIGGQEVVIEREAWLKRNPFIAKQTEAITDYFNTQKSLNKYLKMIPGILKGLAFALASIFGYKLGTATADLIIDAKNNKDETLGNAA